MLRAFIKVSESKGNRNTVTFLVNGKAITKMNMAVKVDGELRTWRIEGKAHTDGEYLYFTKIISGKFRDPSKKIVKVQKSLPGKAREFLKGKIL